MNTVALVTGIIACICAFASALGNYFWIRNERRKLLSREEQNAEDATVFGDVLLPGVPLQTLNEIKLLPYTIRVTAALWRANQGFKASMALMLISFAVMSASLMFLH